MYADFSLRGFARDFTRELLGMLAAHIVERLGGEPAHEHARVVRQASEALRENRDLRIEALNERDRADGLARTNEQLLASNEQLGGQMLAHANKELRERNEQLRLRLVDTERKERDGLTAIEKAQAGIAELTRERDALRAPPAQGVDLSAIRTLIEHGKQGCYDLSSFIVVLGNMIRELPTVNLAAVRAIANEINDEGYVLTALKLRAAIGDAAPTREARD